MVKGMKVNGKMESFMGKALRLYQMEQFSMVNGRPFGSGMCKYPDGAKYTGNWLNGQPHG